jgi:subtilisin family serine protease
MGRRIAALMLVLGLVILAAIGPAGAHAGPAIGTPPALYRSPVPLSAPGGLVEASQYLTVMLELAEPPALAMGAPAAIAARSRQIATAQAGLAAHLAALDAQVLFRATLAYNGIAVLIRADHLDALRALPGVIGVHVIPPKQRATAAAVPFIGAPALWSAPGGATGRGIRIGIIDSGIDYTHADFGGPGTPQAYAANDRTLIEPGTFPTAKVVGGYDFAGDAYDASSADPLRTAPAPDPDPLDCNGHGTHVAGIAAGFGVAADGSTYQGPYTADLDFASFRIGPGVAPEAQLYALKIFGCAGSSTLMIPAIEWALDPNGDRDPSDHLDVVNISLGSPFGSDDDPDAVALNNAVRAGIVAVVAVGDTGNTFYATNSPASAQLAIAVGASVDAARATPSAPTDSLAPFTSRGPQRGNGALKPDLVAPSVDIRSAAVGTGSDARPMSGTSTAAPQVAGAAALLRQLHPHWRPEQIKAALMNTAVPAQMPDGSPAPPSLGGAGRLNLATLGGLELLAYAAEDQTVALTYGAPWIAQPWTATRRLQLENQSDALRSVRLSATTAVSERGVTITLPPGPIEVPPHEHALVPITVTVQPGALDFTPDPATPLEQGGFPRYFLAEHGGYIEVGSGTGVRVRPAHAAHFPSVDFYLDQQLLDDSLDSREVQEYSDTTPGTHLVRLLRPGAPPDAPPLFTAAVQLLDGRDYTLIVVGRPGALGIVVVDETPSAPPPPGQALMHFVNANRTEPTWDIGPLDVYLDGVLRAAGLPVGQASPYIQVAPGTHTVEFFLAGADPASARPVAHKTFVVGAGELVLVGTGRHDDDDGELDDLEQRAFVGRALPRASLALRVPFQIFPKSASDAHVVEGAIVLPPGAQAFAVGLRNSGARNAAPSGTMLGPQVPLASAFELAAASPPIAGLRSSLRAADVQYLGVTSDFAVTQNISNTRIFFGLATYGPWSTPNEVQFRVYIDSNLDGTDDYVVLNTNGSVFGEPPNDVFVSPLYRILPDGSLVANTFTFWGAEQPPTIPPGFDLTPFNTSVMFQMIGAMGIGLPPGQTRFRYHVETLARDADRFGRVVDRVPAVGSLEYDIAHPALAPINVITPLLPNRPVFLDIDGGQIVGGVDAAALAARGTQRLLVLHHHNPPATQAEVVEVRIQPQAALASYYSFLPTVRSGQ